MPALREFVVSLFESLDEEPVRYCVLRNYKDLPSPSSTDIDMLVNRKMVGKFRDILMRCAVRCGCELVQETRFVNYSWVVWDGGDGFLRVDVDTEIRLRAIPFLEADTILGMFIIDSYIHKEISNL